MTLLGKPYATAELAGTRVPAGYRELAASPDGRYLAFVRLGVEVWDSSPRRWMDPAPSIGFASCLRFAGDSRRLVVAAHDRVALFDLEAAPTRKPSLLEPGKEHVTLEPVWSRQKPMTASSKPRADDIGSGRIAEAVVLDGPGIVVTLHHADMLDRKSKPRLRAWDLAKGTRRWDVEAQAGRLLAAPKASVLAMTDAMVLRLYSAADGRSVRTVTSPPSRAVRALVPDASAWLDAERDGTLVRVPLSAETGGAK